MGPALFLGIAAAGGVGAALRFVVDGLVRSRTRGTFPWATVLINVTGSLLLGVITGLAAAHGLDRAWVLVLGGGLLGGYTTFSTASVETVRLAQGRRRLAAAGNAVGTAVLTVAAAAIGLGLTGAL
ncbi:CrcB family protein [Tersicoccus sp. Bi-70]|uniref:fluoride efflux transporter FluC n=1 Tax=Tersicoccus sp. Bi-70 TaxID=1897634 RepID=UPI00097784F8|nr:CrcB family protein [Tersicoccus sp. Bi-70]OMH31587.1 chromosome condensation protein CrcB [Tersicoccus sp. Bi-70]